MEFEAALGEGSGACTLMGALYALADDFTKQPPSSTTVATVRLSGPPRATRLGALHHADLGGDANEAWQYGVAGDCDFDPLGLYASYGDDAAGRKAPREGGVQ